MGRIFDRRLENLAIYRTERGHLLLTEPRNVRAPEPSTKPLL
jgi:hypothetical protein